MTDYSGNREPYPQLLVFARLAGEVEGSNCQKLQFREDVSEMLEAFDVALFRSTQCT
jgi:hypothetical protein